MNTRWYQSAFLLLLGAGCRIAPAPDTCGNGLPEPGEICYSRLESFPVGGDPISVVLGDLDGDDRLDIIVNNLLSEAVSVLLNQGQGEFSPHTLIPVGNAVAIALGDVNGDGALDLVTANSREEAVSVLLNQGDGSFAAPILFPAGIAPSGVAIGDLSGDGRPDLAVPDFLSNTVDIFLQQEDTSFLRAASFEVGSAPQQVAIVDVSGDSLADILVANSDFFFHLLAVDTLSLFLNEGDGSFSSLTLPVGGEPEGLAVGDLDGNSLIDFATANFESGDISVYLSQGGESFSALSPPLPSLEVFSLALGDINQDGALDIAASGPPGLTAHLNDGNGAFSPLEETFDEESIRSVALGDINEDTVPDFVYVIPALDEVRVLFSNP